MNKQAVLVALVLSGLPMLAYASCDSVKAKIDAGLKAKNLSGYTLVVEPKDQASPSGKVVGQCEGDKQILYTKGEATTSDETTAPTDSDGMRPPKRGSMRHGKMHKMQTPASSSSS